MTKNILAKTLSILLTFAMLLAFLPGGFIVAHAESGTCGDNLTWTLENGVLTVSGTGNMYDYSYSFQNGSYYITTAPWGSKSFSTVIINNGVTSIGDYAFRDCTGLTSVAMGNSVTRIGKEAFYNTGYYNDSSNWDSSNRRNGGLYIGKWLITAVKSGSYSIKAGTVGIANSAFSGGKDLTSVTIPTSVTTIGSSAFSYCTGLTSVNITDIAAWCRISFGEYYSNPLCYAHNLYLNGDRVTDLVIPDGVTTIGEWAFLNCTGLRSVTISNGVTSIGARAFRGCAGLMSVAIGDSVTSIGDATFYECTGLTSVTIGNSVTTIGERAFYGCTKLTRVTIPDSVTSIGWSAFRDCTGLKSVVILDGVTSIDNEAFCDCTGLTSVTIPDSVTSIGARAFNNTGYYNDGSNWENGVLYIGKWLIKAKSDDISGTYSIKEGTVGIAGQAFSDCTGLTSVTIPDSVTSICALAFFFCTGLTNMTMGNSVTSIGIRAFDNTGYYNDGSNWEDGLLYYGKWLIRAKTDISACTIKDGTIGIAGGAFGSCANLTAITVPDSVTSIGNSAFDKCAGLTSITIPDSVTSIGYDAFSNCNELVCLVNKYSYAYEYVVSNELEYALLPPSRIEIAQLPYKLTYLVGKDELDVTGGSLTLYYSNDMSDTISMTSSMISGFDNTVVGPQTLTVNYEGKTTTFEVEIIDWIEVTTLPTKTSYLEGKDTLNVSGGKITFHYDNDKTKVVSMTLSMVSGFDNTIIGSQTLTVTYDGKTTTFDVTIIAKTPTSISILQLPYKLEYVLNKDQLDVTGGKVKVGYDNGKYETLDMTADMISGFDDNTPGPAALTVTQGSVSATFTVVFYGVCGDDLLWTKPDDDTVVFTGSGDMYDYNSGNAVPWGYGIKNVEFDPDMTSIGAYAFSNCNNLTSVMIPSGVTSIGDYAFPCCTSLTSLTIPDSVTSIGDYAFDGCRGLTSVKIPDGVTNIGSYAFYDCTGLTSVTLPDGLVSIGCSAFSYCDSLRRANIPESIETIGDKAFYNCSDLARITISGTPVIGADVFTGTSYYNNASNWQRFTVPINDNFEYDEYTVLFINSCLIAFTGGSRIRDYEIPRGTVAIAGEAFAGCANLTAVTIPSSVKTIGANAFKDCASITLNVTENSRGHRYAKENGIRYSLRFLMLGDPDDDGRITVGDALSALRIAARIVPVTDDMLDCCDIDGDGKVTVGDALSILRVAARIVDSL